MSVSMWALLWSCASPQTPPPAEPLLSAPPVPGQAQDNADPDCVAACERQNMARAVAPEIIRSDCEQACSGTDPETPAGLESKVEPGS